MSRYKAFISYSHRDRAVARKLHRRLETWRVPKRLVGQVTENGPIPSRLAPVFCDREDLSAATDLAVRVREAIVESEFLIVLCSPAAAGSPWVEQEILAFKRAHGEDRILSVIIAGEPFASDDPGRMDEECFPHALRYRMGADGRLTRSRAEPVAADLRAHEDGWRMGFLKLAAGLLGVELDALVHRDAQRRHRRATAIAAASLAGMVVMGFLTFQAVEGRQAAELQRRQAEGLVEFMLNDLRTKLEPVGRLEVLDSLGRRVLAYYATQTTDALDPDSLGRRARALHLIGEIAGLRGNLGDALATFEEAAATTAELLSRDPGDGQRVFDHAQSVFWVGYMAWQDGRLELAQKEFEEYEALARRLVTMQPENIDWRAELGYAKSNLGTLALERGRPDAAREAFEAALETFTEVARADPGSPAWRIEVAQTRAWLADTLEQRWDFAAAAGHRTEELAAYRSLLDADPNHAIALQSMPVTYQALGRLALAQGDGDGALANYALANRSSARLVAMAPDNTVWREIAVTGRIRSAEAFIYSGAYAQALQELALGEDLLAPLAGAANGARSWAILARLLEYLGALAAAATGDDASALNLVQRAAAGLESLDTGIFDSRLSPWRSEVELLLGRLLEQRNEQDRARRHWEAGLAALDGAPQPLPPTELTIAAELLWQLGETDRAESLVRSAADSWRHPRFVRLKAAIAAAGEERARGS